MRSLAHLPFILLLAVTFTACRMPGVAVEQPDATAPGNTSVAAEQQRDNQATIEAAVQATTEATQPDISATSLPTEEQVPTEPANEEPAQPTPTQQNEATEVQTVFTPDDTSTSTQPAAAEQADAETATEDVPIVFAPESGTEAQITVNIQLVFDASGSMAEDIGGETKIAAARRAMEQVIDQLETDNPNLNVGFRVFGHEGDNTEAGKAVSCQSTELLVPVSGVNTDLLRQQTNAWDPTGWTPISLALQRAGEDLTAGENVRNVIIMVTDGEETCDGDPCAVAKALADAAADVRIDVVGFGLAPEVADTLRCIADNSGGAYTDAQDGDALVQTLEELIAATVQRSYLRFVPIGPGGQPAEVYISGFANDQGESMFGSRTDTGEQIDSSFISPQRVDLQPGTYRFTVSRGDDRYDQVSNHVFTDYTAELAEGQETVATIGFGGLTLTSANDEIDPNTEVEVERLIGESWETTIFASDIELNYEYHLAPGSYRVINSEQDDAVIQEFTITPGEQVTVDISMQRSYLRFETVGPDGQPLEVHLSGFVNDQGQSMFGSRTDTGEQIEANFSGSQRVDLQPGTYRFTVSRGDSRDDQVSNHQFTDYTAEIAAGKETVAVIGFGGMTLTHARGELDPNTELEVTKQVNGNWARTIFASNIQIDYEYQLAPGLYRLMNAEQDTVLQEFVINPGKQITVQIDGS